MRQVNNTLPTSSSSDELAVEFDLFQCPFSCSTSPATNTPLQLPLSSSMTSVLPIHVDLLTPTLLDTHSSQSASTSAVDAFDPLLSCDVDETVVPTESQLTPCLGWRLDTRPTAADEVMVVTLNNMPLQQQLDAESSGSSLRLGERDESASSLSIDTGAGEAEDSVNAMLTSLLSSGLSASRRFSYPPTSHTLASLPNQPHLAHSTSTSSTVSTASSSSAGGPLRSASPALMSPTAASSFFQTLDRKRAFKPYYRAPTFTSNSVHRVQLTVSLRQTAGSPRSKVEQGRYTAAVYAVDPSNASIGLVGYERLSDDKRGGTAVWCWQVGVQTCMMLCTLSRQDDSTDCAEGELGESRLWSEYFTVQQLLKDKSLALKGNEWSGREELAVEVQSVHSLLLDDEHDRHTLRQHEHECSMLREALHATDHTRRQHSGVAHDAVKQPVRAVSAGEAGEVKC